MLEMEKTILLSLAGKWKIRTIGILSLSFKWYLLGAKRGGHLFLELLVGFCVGEVGSPTPDHHIMECSPLEFLQSGHKKLLLGDHLHLVDGQGEGDAGPKDQCGAHQDHPPWQVRLLMNGVQQHFSGLNEGVGTGGEGGGGGEGSTEDQGLAGGRGLDECVRNGEGGRGGESPTEGLTGLDEGVRTGVGG